MLERWRARRAEKAAAVRAQQRRGEIIARVSRAVEAADPARIQPAAAATLARALAGPAGRALSRSLHGPALAALAELQASLTAADPMTAETAERLYIAVDDGLHSPEPSEVLEAVENWAGYLKDPSADAAASVLWLCVLASEDEEASLQEVLLELGL